MVRMQNVSIVVIVLLFTSITPTAFAERTVDFVKVIDVDKSSIDKYFKDFQSIKQIFPKSIKSIEPIKQTENENIFKLNLKMNGVSLNPQVLYKNSDDKHLLKILDGELKGTVISTELHEIWGFDGTPNQGTIVNVKTKLNTSGFFSIINLIPESAIIYTLDYGFSSIASDTSKDSFNNFSEKSSKKARSR
ncbi:hypothetical protein [Nitrosopumilus sp.]|uniref:hypothetical protein n=1 Tax=Nitrosopumilus sp. TaxID=2024843 RepID=UPI003D0F22B3